MANQLLTEARQALDGAIRGDTAMGTFYTLQAIGMALIAVAEALQEPKRPHWEPLACECPAGHSGAKYSAGAEVVRCPVCGLLDVADDDER